ncbi:hypothetical protein BDZ97DRAFT_1784118 [Flammula alnicola]|nr:hypothetical protein BDZ97DRAFT_1784118 [Flammula alnicola]
MPFSVDTSWPQGLRQIFSICRQQSQPFENRYYGPYDKLLNYCFETDSFRFFVAPQYPPSELSSRDALHFVVFIMRSRMTDGLVSPISAWQPTSKSVVGTIP